MKMTRIKLEENSNNEVWLHLEFDDGVKGCINVQNMCEKLRCLLPNPPTEEKCGEQFYIVQQLQAKIRALYGKAIAIPQASQRAQFNVVVEGLRELSAVQ